MKKKGFSIIFSFGKYGGFYFDRGYCTRLCLGWMAITYLPEDFDNFADRVLPNKK